MGKNTDLTQFEKKRTALVEVTVHKEEIAELLQQGMSITAIHKGLVDKYSLKTTYSGFIKVLGRINVRESIPQKNKRAPLKAAATQDSSVQPASQQTVNLPNSAPNSAPNSTSNNASVPQTKVPAKPLATAKLGKFKEEEVHSNVPDDNLTSYSTDKATT